VLPNIVVRRDQRCAETKNWRDQKQDENYLLQQRYVLLMNALLNLSNDRHFTLASPECKAIFYKQ
jgi:hypothetical protein